jgi:hypothetical protein
VLRKRMEYPKLKRAVREHREAFEVRVVLIEDQVSGTRLIEELGCDGLRTVTRYHPQSDKIMCMHAQTRPGVWAPYPGVRRGSARPGPPRAPNVFYIIKKLFFTERKAAVLGRKTAPA